MEPRFRNYLVLAAVLFIGLATAMAVYVARPGQRDANQPPDASKVVGLVVRVDSEGLTDVRSFALRADGDSDILFSLERLQNGAQFPPGHLVEHQASSQPIVVWYEADGGIYYALWLADAEQTG